MIEQLKNFGNVTLHPVSAIQSVNCSNVIAAFKRDEIFLRRCIDD